MLKYQKFILLTILLLSLSAFSGLSVKKGCDSAAYLSASPSEWEKRVENAKLEFHKNTTNENKFSWIMEKYGLLYSTMKEKDEDTFEKYVDRTVENCEDLITQGYKIGECNAILSSIMGLRIAYSPWKGMFLGSRSTQFITRALEHSPESALVQQLYANHQNFTPEMWGGSTENSIKAYKKAISIYEQANNTDCWMYLDAMAWLGLMYKKEGRENDALKVWNKALDHEPGFVWVSDHLIPGL